MSSWGNSVLSVSHWSMALAMPKSITSTHGCCSSDRSFASMASLSARNNRNRPSLLGRRGMNHPARRSAN
jgi:hypothetical protein